MALRFITTEILTGIADSIRAKTGTTDKITPSTMASQIDSIEIGSSGGGSSDGGGGTIEVTNGRKWTSMEVGSEDLPIGFRKLRYADGLWVGGTNQGIYYSEDGFHWTQSNITSGTVVNVMRVDGKWFGISSSKVVYYSEDGKNWSSVSMGSGQAKVVLYRDGKWILGYGSYGFYTSGSGTSYTLATDFNYGINSFYEHKTGLIILATSNGGLWYSTNGINWTQSNIKSGGFQCVRYNNGIFVAGSNSNGLYYSTDGQTWTQSNVTTASFYGVDYANGTWVANSFSTGATGIWYSSNGKNWTKSNITGMCDEVWYINGVWVTMWRDNGVYYSLDGKTWTQSDTTDCTAYYFAEGNGLLINYSSATVRYSRAW